jgi:hypothetical protein
MALSNANLDMLAGGVLAYWSHEMGHVLMAIALGVPIVGVRWRKLGLAIQRKRVGGWRDRAVTGAGMLANLWLAWFAIRHGDPWGSFCNLFMLVGTQVYPWRYSDLRRLINGD